MRGQSTQPSRRRALHGVLWLTLLISFCGAPASAPVIPALEFAGADLPYVLKRLSAEAGLQLLLDEIRIGSETEGILGLHRVDRDFKAGPLRDALDQLRRESGASFSYEVRDSVLIVQNAQAVAREAAASPSFDRESFPRASLNVDLKQLIAWISEQAPGTYLRLGGRRGQPLLQKVQLEIPEGANVIDVLAEYAGAIKRDLRLRRAGQRVRGEPSLVVASTLDIQNSQTEARRTPEHVQPKSVVWSLAQVEARAGIPLCILDRALLFDARGSLTYQRRVDRGWALDEALVHLASHGDERPPDYVASKQDGSVLIRTQVFEAAPASAREFLNQKVAGGSFRGSLPELARRLNASLAASSAQVLSAGEIVKDDSSASIELSDGMTVLDALLVFAKATGRGWTLTLRNLELPGLAEKATWDGAYLAPLREPGA